MKSRRRIRHLPNLQYGQLIAAALERVNTTGRRYTTGMALTFFAAREAGCGPWPLQRRLSRMARQERQMEAERMAADTAHGVREIRGAGEWVPYEVSVPSVVPNSILLMPPDAGAIVGWLQIRFGAPGSRLSLRMPIAHSRSCLRSFLGLTIARDGLNGNSTGLTENSRQSAKRGLPMPVSTKTWVVVAVERRCKSGNVPDRISAFARELHGAMVKAVERGEVKSAYKTSGAIEKYLRAWRLWPVDR
jgi:hypothetical protein